MAFISEHAVAITFVAVTAVLMLLPSLFPNKFRF